MSLEFIGFTIGTIGKIMVAFTAVAVHYRVWKEHQIDDKVFKEMRRERVIGVVGIALMVLGYLIEIPERFPGL